MKYPEKLADHAVMLFVDHQAGIMDRGRTNDKATVGKVVSALVKLGQIFEMPMLVSTVPGPDGKPPSLAPEVADALNPLPRFMRHTTDSLQNDEIHAAIAGTGRKTLLICGVITEVAVQRPALSGVLNGFHVEVVLDGCMGNSERSEQASIHRLTQAGVVLTSLPQIAGELAVDFTDMRAQQAITVLMGA